MQNNSEKKFDQYLDHLEFLSSKIADNISMGLFENINKMDYERKAIINKISSDTANLNTIRRDRLKLVWVNNNKMINKLEKINQNNKKKYIKLKKTVKEYSKDF
ncbi:hypothetical protein N9V56_02090 [Alphaproteobacteria bacterium]|nr:hypothetical protein [Alphaproteobacteria bacterium]